MQGNALFDMRKRPLRIKETPLLNDKGIFLNLNKPLGNGL